MQTLDMRQVSPGTVLETDLAIVGTGPAGLSIAREFLSSGVGVVLLESGGLEEAPEVAPSETFESHGDSRLMDPRRVRNRGLGGSSQTWSGKCKTFDEIDFERRDWVPNSGWPISKAELRPYEERAAEAMHLGPNVYDGRLWPMLGRREPAVDVSPDLLEPCFWQFSRDPDQPVEFLQFGKQFLKNRAANIRIFTHATTTHIDTDEYGQLNSLEITSAPGRKHRVVCRTVILAAGGIENARLLLVSNRTRAAGLGNGSGLVGRYLMDHPRISLGEFKGAAARAIQARLGLYQLRQPGKTSFYSHGVALSPKLQRKERLLNCAAYLSEHRSPADPWDAINRLRMRQSTNRLRDAACVVSSPGLLLDGIYRRAFKGRSVQHKIEKLSVDCLVEQVPDPESRITLSDSRDELGLPIPSLKWKISDLEKRSVAKLAEVFSQEIERLGLEAPVRPAWQDGCPESGSFTDVAHPTGTTRMSDSAQRGVVDADCQLHEARGIYIAGSSVFPTASHANPTLNIVAMSLRLADTIKSRHFSG